MLISAAFLIAIGFGLVAPALPQYARAFGVSVTLVTLVVSAFAFMRFLSAPVAGRLIGRLGERRVYLTGLGIVALSTGACAFAGDYWLLLVLRGLGGVGSSMFTVSALSLLVRVSPAEHRGRVSSYYGSAFLIGGILGPVVGAALLTVSAHFAFLAYAATLLLALMIVAVLMPRRVGAAPSADAGDESGPVMTVRQAARIPQYRGLLLSGFANGWATFGFRSAVIPLFVLEVLHAGEAMAGIALMIFAVGNAAVIIPSGRWSDRFGRRPLIILGAVCTAAGMAGIGLTASTPVFVACALLAGAGSGLFGPSQQAGVADVIGPRRAGSAIAAYQMTVDCGAMLGPVLSGVVIDHAGYPAGFLVTGGLLALSAVVWVALPDTRRPARP